MLQDGEIDHAGFLSLDKIMYKNCTVVEKADIETYVIT